MAHYHMIQYSCANHVQSVLEGGGELAVGLAGLRITGGMVVNHNYGRGIMF
ncbi:hypothetical protein D3C86_1344690 [compost metagenome]